jgi:peptide/nickel transport system substrate-binding protein
MRQARRNRERWAPVTALLAAVTLTLAACDPGGGTDEGGDGDTAAEAEGSAGGTFVAARTGDIDLLDPHGATAFQTIQTLGLVYEPLLRIDREGELEPALASAWEVASDGLTVTFTLRDDVTFHNGEALAAEDVKASLDRILDEANGAVGRSNLLAIESVEAPEDTTVVLHLVQPDTALLYALALTNSSVLDSADAAGAVESGDALEPNGTGPFRFGAWEQGQRTTLEANADYWGGAPTLGGIEFRVIPDEASILAGMRAGNFDLGTVTDPGVADSAGDGDGFTLVTQPTLAYHTFMLNGRRPPLDQLEVRQAIACAVDRQQVIDTALFGEGEVTGPITSPAFAYSPTEGLPCDPPDLDAARQLLESAGHADGFTLGTLVMTGGYATAVNQTQNLQSQLAEIGVTLELEQLPTSQYVDRWLAADYDATVALNGGQYDPFLMYGRYFTADGSLTGPAGLEAPELDELLAAGNTSSDDAERQEVYQELQEALLRLSPWVWMFQGQDYYLVADDVQDFTPMPDQSLRFLQATTLGA